MHFEALYEGNDVLCSAIIKKISMAMSLLA